MVEQAYRHDSPSKPSALAISVLSDRTLLRLKSWKPATASEQQAVVLDGLATVGELVADLPQVLCLGPGEWLLMARREPIAAGWREQLERDAQSRGIAVVDVSDGLQGFGLQGVAVRDLLSKGCGVDFHEKQFPSRRCVRTRLAQIPVVIVRLEEFSGFELYAARSHVQYLKDWLNDSSMEVLSQ